MTTAATYLSLSENNIWSWHQQSSGVSCQASHEPDHENRKYNQWWQPLPSQTAPHLQTSPHLPSCRDGPTAWTGHISVWQVGDAVLMAPKTSTKEHEPIILLSRQSCRQFISVIDFVQWVAAFCYLLRKQTSWALLRKVTSWKLQLALDCFGNSNKISTLKHKICGQISKMDFN